MQSRPKVAGRERGIYALITRLPFCARRRRTSVSTCRRSPSWRVTSGRWSGWAGCRASASTTTCARSSRAATATFIQWDRRFVALRGHYAFHTTACTPATPREKGSVEGAVGYVKTGFWPARRIASLADLDEQY